MRNFLFSLVAGLVLVPGIALAGVDAADIPSVNGKGIAAETGEAGGAGESFVGVVIYLEADDTAAYGGPTGATLDKGDEACAVYGMSCFAVWTITTGADADITVDADGCTSDTTIADNAESLVFCY